MAKTLDLRIRCARCKVLKPRVRGSITRMRAEQFEAFSPYCSFNCQEWAKLERAHEFVQSLRRNDAS